MEYSERMKEVRNSNDVLQKTIANFLGLSPYTYSHYETGDTTIPIKHLISFCDYFDVSIDYILDLTNTKQYKNSIKDIDNIKAGMRLKEFRKDFKITQKKLATTLNTTQGVIANYERGRNIIATPFLYTICKKYGVSADYLLGKIDTKIN